MGIVEIGDSELTLQNVLAIAHGALVTLTQSAQERIKQSHRNLEKQIAHGKTIYGVTTGFGKLYNTAIPKKEQQHLQLNLLRSHACGVGKPIPVETARAIMAIKINTFAQGYSGIRLEVVELLVELLNKKITPVIPEKGSMGASGDLAPLAHMSLVLVGEGKAYYHGKHMEGSDALKSAGLTPVVLEAKEGLALINGTHFMAAQLCMLVDAASELTLLADIAAAMSLEAVCGSLTPFDERIQQIKPYVGQGIVAQNIRALSQGSVIQTKSRRVQDPYSFRCVPQVHGATRDVLTHVQATLHTDINAVTDNPLVFENDVLSGGNFHGQNLALASDYLILAISELAAISERRIDHLMRTSMTGAPAFLAHESGLNSGFMIMQYTAASLVAENKSLLFPASGYTVPVSDNQEDHTSMGPNAIRKTAAVIENTRTALAIELLCAAQAFDMVHQKQGVGTHAAFRSIRESIPAVHADRSMAHDIECIVPQIKQIIKKIQTVVELL